MPINPSAVYEGYYNTSPECWSVYTEVLGSEFGNALLIPSRSGRTSRRLSTGEI
jgi:hypothetical protein